MNEKKLVMPKGDGRLDLAIQSLKIYYEHGDWMTNEDFIKTFIAQDNSYTSKTDTAMILHKARTARYFGLIKYIFKGNGNVQGRQAIITERGKRFYEAFLADNKSAMIDTLMDSIKYYTYGRNNYATSETDSDVEPPRVLIKAAYQLEYLTKNEFIYLMYSMHDEGKDYSTVIEEIKHFRESNEEAKLPIHLSDTDAAHFCNVYGDWKFIQLLREVGIIKNFTDKVIISDDVKLKYKSFIEGISTVTFSSENSYESYTNAVNTECLDVEENERRFRMWMRDQKTVKGTNCTASTISNNANALKDVCNRIIIDEYPDVRNMFEIVDVNMYHGIKEAIKNHPEYDKVNKSFGNRYLNTALLWYERYLDEINANNVLESKTSYKLDAYGKQDFLKDIFISSDEYDTLKQILEYKKNIILQGSPGVGKTYLAKKFAYSLMGICDENRVQLIQFHQNYSYEDFIMGYKPNGDGFELQEGLFYKFCKRAEEDENNSYFFIIDEINRGNVSKIFGELMVLIEREKRANEFVTLAYRDEKFTIPSNIYIIGMMNTADRSLAILDYALRRRFCFYEIKPAFGKESFEQKLASNGISKELIKKINDNFIKLNDYISDEKNSGLGTGFRIGHSYFCDKPNCIESTWYENIVRFEIAPLLEEYWFDEKNKATDWIGKIK